MTFIIEGGGGGHLFGINMFGEVSLKIVSLIYFMVSEMNILTKFRQTICFFFLINCTSFEKMHGFSINRQ